MPQDGRETVPRPANFAVPGSTTLNLVRVCLQRKGEIGTHFVLK